MMRTLRRSIRGLVVAVAFVALTGCASDGPAGRPPPTQEVLRQWCDQVYREAGEVFAAQTEFAEVDNGLGLTGGKGSVSCHDDGWTFKLGERPVRVELALLFTPLGDSGEPRSDYCASDGVRIQTPATGHEERTTAGQRYCFSWYRGESAQSASTGFVDRRTAVFMMWDIGYDGDAFDTGGSLGPLLSKANETVVKHLHASFDHEN
jgi:hypothetical protein